MGNHVDVNKLQADFSIILRQGSGNGHVYTRVAVT